MDDSKIIELFFLRNEDAIRHTHDIYGRRLFILADNIVKDDQDAEESVNDTYMKAWDTIPPQKPTHFLRIWRKFVGISLWISWIGSMPPSEMQRLSV